MSAILACLINLSVSAAVCFLKKNNGLQDIFWGLGFVLISIMTFPLGALNEDHLSVLPLIIFNSLVWLWGIRLAAYLLIRNWGKPEDFRYAQWRSEWKASMGSVWWVRALLQVFMLQGFLMWVVSTPIWFSNSNLSPSTNLLAFYSSTSITLFGIIYEAIADYQKYQFKKQKPPNGTFIQTGLWKHSRHPNYFGEICTWWGIGLMGVALTLHPLPLLGPIVIHFLLVKVSGIPMLEKKQIHNAEYKEYAKHTPALLPKIF